MRKYFFLLVFLFPFISVAQKAVPEFWSSQVDDDAGVLSPATLHELEKKLAAYRDSTSNEIAVLIVPSLEGDPIEEYALRVAEKLALGQKKKDNGALLLIAVDDHKIRIEVGMGLEGVLTDVMCSRIIRNEIAPNFRASDYDKGVVKGVEAMILAIGNAYTADDNAFAAPEMTWKERLLVGIFIFSILGVFTVFGLLLGSPGWVLYVFLIPFYATFPMLIFPGDGGVRTLIGYLVLFPILKLIIGVTPWGKAIAKKVKTTRGSGGGWSSGSGWSGGGSSSSGGFSGGGGSFGGGGASGSW